MVDPVKAGQSLAVFHARQHTQETQRIASEETLDFIIAQETLPGEHLEKFILETFEMLCPLYHVPIDAKEQPLLNDREIAKYRFIIGRVLSPVLFRERLMQGYVRVEIFVLLEHLADVSDPAVFSAVPVLGTPPKVSQVQTKFLVFPDD